RAGTRPRHHAQIVFLAQSGKANVRDVDRLIQPTLKDETGAPRAVSLVLHEGSGRNVAGQEARQVAAAVKSTIEGVEWTHGACVKSARTLSHQLCLAAPHKFRAE